MSQCCLAVRRQRVTSPIGQRERAHTVPISHSLSPATVVINGIHKRQSPGTITSDSHQGQSQATVTRDNHKRQSPGTITSDSHQGQSQATVTRDNHKRQSPAPASMSPTRTLSKFRGRLCGLLGGGRLSVLHTKRCNLLLRRREQGCHARDGLLPPRLPRRRLRSRTRLCTRRSKLGGLLARPTRVANKRIQRRPESREHLVCARRLQERRLLKLPACHGHRLCNTICRKLRRPLTLSSELCGKRCTHSGLLLLQQCRETGGERFSLEGNGGVHGLRHALLCLSRGIGNLPAALLNRSIHRNARRRSDVIGRRL
eukprot:Opistho-2@89108